MREAAGLPAGILVYVTAMTLILLICQHVFVAPQEWSRLITFATVAVSFVAACSASKFFTTAAGVKIFAAFIAIFWLVFLGADMLDIFSDAVEFLEGGSDEGTPIKTFIKFVDAVWNSKICAGVTIVLALWTVSR